MVGLKLPPTLVYLAIVSTNTNADSIASYNPSYNADANTECDPDIHTIDVAAAIHDHDFKSHVTGAQRRATSDPNTSNPNVAVIANAKCFASLANTVVKSFFDAVT
ncbi:hypothetical protein ATCC90586_004457 [Pythium insidiosum]|nr:hypothetical protein ATCC90586_004457 [Pythium insidiosum]